MSPRSRVCAGSRLGPRAPPSGPPQLPDHLGASKCCQLQRPQASNRGGRCCLCLLCRGSGEGQEGLEMQHRSQSIPQSACYITGTAAPLGPSPGLTSVAESGKPSPTQFSGVPRVLMESSPPCTTAGPAVSMTAYKQVRWPFTGQLWKVNADSKDREPESSFMTRGTVPGDIPSSLGFHPI